MSLAQYIFIYIPRPSTIILITSACSMNNICIDYEYSVHYIKLLLVQYCIGIVFESYYVSFVRMYSVPT